MKKSHLLSLLICVLGLSCSKSSGDPVVAEQEIAPADTATPPLTVSEKNKAYYRALLGTWVLVKEISDMGPVSRATSYKRTIIFDSTFLYTDSIIYDASNKTVAKAPYKVEVKEAVVPGYNPYIFLDIDKNDRIPRTGVFRGTGNDTLAVFNGVGSEYYKKAL